MTLETLNLRAVKEFIVVIEYDPVLVLCNLTDHPAWEDVEFAVPFEMPLPTPR